MSNHRDPIASLLGKLRSRSQTPTEESVSGPCMPGWNKAEGEPARSSKSWKVRARYGKDGKECRWLIMARDLTSAWESLLADGEVVEKYDISCCLSSIRIRVEYMDKYGYRPDLSTQLMSVYERSMKAWGETEEPKWDETVHTETSWRNAVEGWRKKLLSQLIPQSIVVDQMLDHLQARRLEMPSRESQGSLGSRRTGSVSTYTDQVTDAGTTVSQAQSTMTAPSPDTKPLSITGYLEVPTRSDSQSSNLREARQTLSKELPDAPASASLFNEMKWGKPEGIQGARGPVDEQSSFGNISDASSTSAAPPTSPVISIGTDGSGDTHEKRRTSSLDGEPDSSVRISAILTRPATRPSSTTSTGFLALGRDKSSDGSRSPRGRSPFRR